jgi:hypothetical protein
MSSSNNNRGGLDDAPFSYRAANNGKVFISWRGQRAATLAGRQAAAFLSRVSSLDVSGQQLAMAKITGNFKRGNEHSK